MLRDPSFVDPYISLIIFFWYNCNTIFSSLLIVRVGTPFPLLSCCISSLGQKGLLHGDGDRCWVRCMHCSNYEARGASGNYEAWGASGDYEAWGASGGKYKAQMVIFCILAAVNRFSWISWKEESR